MIIQSRLAEGETHQPERQAVLEKRAQEIAYEISHQTGVIAVLLSGSVARGPVVPSSDLDLHVVVSDSFSYNFPEWKFGKDGLIENLHKISESQLQQGWNTIGQPTSLAHWFYKNKLGDELYGYKSLFFDLASNWNNQLSMLLSYRTSPDIIPHLVYFHADGARHLLIRAEEALEGHAIMDAHQELRWSIQSLLISAMIQCGWVIRGSKKRIEIAKSFIPNSAIEAILEMALDIVGLRNLSKKQANEICKARLACRKLVLDELLSLKSTYSKNNEINKELSKAIVDQEQHNAYAFDYYEPLIQQGFFLGPINHIRSLSGFPRVPNFFLSCIGQKYKWPIQEFLNSSKLSESLKNKWLCTADLTASKTHCRNLIYNLKIVAKKFFNNAFTDL